MCCSGKDAKADGEAPGRFSEKLAEMEQERRDRIAARAADLIAHEEAMHQGREIAARYRRALRALARNERVEVGGEG